MKKDLVNFVCILFILSSCSTSRVRQIRDDNKIDLTFIQVNDVYEIAPLEGGKSGGFARIAHLKKALLEKNSNTFMVMSGDFLSPSVYNSLQLDGKRIRGKQMVETMNVAGMDIAVFGNHEFDITENELQSRLNESNFLWISSNSFHKKNNVIQPFHKKYGTDSVALPDTHILTIRDTDGTIAKIGIIGINIPFNKATYVSYTDPLLTAEKLYNRLKDSCDIIIAITHQLINDDILLAKRLPGLALIMGGHEHDERYHKEGNVIITKAHANAKSAYILNLRIRPLTNAVKVSHKLQMIDQSVLFDPPTDSVVKKWTDIAEKSYASLGFNAKNIIKTSGDSLEGREGEIRNHPTNFTRLIVSSIHSAAPESQIAILNAGSIRLDDILQMPVSEYDILRSLPFGGGIVEVEMKGSLLTRILEAGRSNINIGGFLHYSETVRYDSGKRNWLLNNAVIDSQKLYRIALTEFLLTGGEANMEFLKLGNPDITKIYPQATSISDPRSDIRLAVIKYFSR